MYPQQSQQSQQQQQQRQRSSYNGTALYKQASDLVEGLDYPSENEDDIGALGSILSWDEEDEDDEGQAVNRSAAAMSSALRERESATGTSAPPDMVQFSMKDGVPQFNFLSNAAAGMNALANGQSSSGAANSSAGATAQQNNNDGDGNSSSITLQLPMPTPISNFESQPQPPKEEQPPGNKEQQQQPATQLQPSVNSSSNNNLEQLVSKQQTQQGLAATFAQLLAQQAGTLFQQQQQQQQQPAQPNNPPQQQPAQPKAQPVGNQTQQQQQQAVQAIQQAQQQLQLAQQQALQQAQTPAPAQQQVQPTQIPQPQQAQQTLQQPAAPQSNSQAANGPQQQAPQIPPQLQLPFGTDPNAFLQQLQFAHFQQQMQLQAQQQQQQQQQGQSMATAPTVPGAVSLPFAQPAPAAIGGPALNPIQQEPESQPPPAKKARKTKSTPAVKPASSKSAPKKPAPSSSPAGASAKAGIVSASDTDCDNVGMNNKSNKITASKKASPSLSASEPVPSSAVAALSAAASAKAASKAVDDGKDKSDANMSADEKAQANRDRNREHARNTRLRKKAYLEKLKTTVEELCRERDTLVSERAGAASLLVEMHNTRTEVLMSFFALRSSNEKRRKLWSSILDESSFTCIMPVTPYRSFPASEVQVSKCQRTVMGIDAVMADTSSLHVLFQSLVDRTRFPNAKIEFRYTLVTEESVVAGNQMMARWVMSTVNATKCGALTEVAKQGMLCCKFNSAHRIIGLELMFDVMAFMLQLKQAAGSDSFSVIPNTVQTCQRTFDKPMVMTLADPPFTIVQVNKLWEEMTGYKAEEVVGKASCRILQGSKMDKSTLAPMMEEIRFKRPGSAYIKNVKKSGEEFMHYVLVFPLSTDSRVTHYVSLSNHVELCSAKKTLPPLPPPQAAAAPQQAGAGVAPSASGNAAAPQAPLVPNVQNGVTTPQGMPQFFMANQTISMSFHPQVPQPVVSNKIQIQQAGAAPVMAPPPNAPPAAQAAEQPPA